MTMILQATPFACLLLGTDERSDGHLMSSTEVLDHVERPDLSAALGWEREAVADVEDLHGFSSFLI